MAEYTVSEIALCLSRLVECLPDAILLITDDDQILDTNPAATQLFRRSTDEFRMIGAMAVFDPADPRLIDALDRQRRNGEYRGELTLVRKGGEQFEAQVVLMSLNIRGSRELKCALVRDISDQRSLEAGMRVKENALATSINAIAITELDGKVSYANLAFVRMFGYADKSEVLGLTPPDFSAHPDETGRIISQMREGHSYVGFITGQRKDGSTFPAEISANVVIGDRGHVTHLMASFADLTERRRLERALLNAVEDERRNLGAELHDGLGQELTGLALLARGLAESVKKGHVSSSDDLEELSELANHIIATCRAITRGLSPLSAHGGDLIGALREFVSGFTKHQGPVVQLEVMEVSAVRVSPDVGDHLYRIAQEAVNNALRHAQAEVITVRVDVEPASLRLAVLDDGRGLDARAPAGARGLGVASMHYRALSIGARLSLSAREDGGTQVLCECPQVTGGLFRRDVRY